MNTTANTTDSNSTSKFWVAYYRTSTRSQNLGLEAQRDRVLRAAQEQGATIIAEVQEQESGKECDRPELNKALALTRKHRATLVVAKADRLSRDLGFATDLVFKSGLTFCILNMPEEATRDYLLFGVYFGLAAQEAKLISDRTKAALQALKEKGVKLGNPKGAEAITPEMVKNASEARTRKANENPNNITSANEIRAYISTNNATTLQAIADHLNNKGFLTSRGNFHTRKSVQLLCQRYGIAI